MYSRIVIFILFALIFIHQAPQSTAIEFGMFSENTIYSKDKHKLKDRILLLFHGLGSAHPNGTFRRLEKAFSNEFSVVGVNYEYMDVDRNVMELEDLWNRYLKGKDVSVLGTSLGGFWANYFSNKYGIKRMVVVNPVTSPLKDLTQFLGRRYSEYRQKNFTVTEKAIRQYSNLDVPVHGDTKSLVFLTMDDPVIDFTAAEGMFSSNPNSRVILHESGGHSLPLSDPLYLTVLKVFFSEN